MKPTAEDIRVLVVLLRAYKHCHQAPMAAAAGIDPTTLWRYEEGIRTPPRQVLERLAAVAGVPLWAVDGVLLPAIGVGGMLSRGGALAPGTSDSPMASMLGEESAAAAAGIAEFMAGWGPGDESSESAAATGVLDPAVDIDPWALLEPRSSAPSLSGDAAWRQEYQAAIASLCAASVRAAADHTARALELARTALRFAELAPGDTAWRYHGIGFSWAFIGNAQRVVGDLFAAEASFLTAWKFWRAAGTAAGGPLAEWRLLDLEASLRRDLRQFAAALGLLEHALATAPVAARGHILLNKAASLEQAGDIPAAWDSLREAAPLVDLAGEPRSRLVLRFNELALLCHLGRHADAEARLPALLQLSTDLGNDLDLLRVRWLDGRIAAGLGRRDQARAAFSEVRSGFAQRCDGYNNALVSLDLAILALEEGRRTEVRELAEEMLWIFSSRRIHREALAALSLFREAVAADTVTAGFARQVLNYLENARTDPRLSFPGTGSDTLTR